MALKVVTISDGFESSSVPAVNLPTVVSTGGFYKLITAPEIIAQKIVLPIAPTKPTEAVLFWAGVTQYYGTDYTVSGTNLNLLTRLLNTISPNDEIVVIYT